MNLTQQAILDAQYMLNQLSRRDPVLPRLPLNGIFDELMLEAVMIFQRDHALPVTGVIDVKTWDTLVYAYQKNQLHFSTPTPLRVLSHGGFSTEEGSSSHPMLIADAIFYSLRSLVQNLSHHGISGHNTDHSHKNLKIIQELSGLPVTGTLDRATWEQLVRLYHALVVREPLRHSHL